MTTTTFREQYHRPEIKQSADTPDSAPLKSGPRRVVTCPRSRSRLAPVALPPAGGGRLFSAAIAVSSTHRPLPSWDSALAAPSADGPLGGPPGRSAAPLRRLGGRCDRHGIRPLDAAHPAHLDLWGDWTRPSPAMIGVESQGQLCDGKQCQGQRPAVG